MSTVLQPVLSEAESRAIRRGVPDPGMPPPAVSIPTLLLWIASLALWVFATWLVLGTNVTPWATIPLHAVVTYTMFTVLHECAHHAAGRLTWVNEVLGRVSIPFMAAFSSFPALRHIHIEHHRNTNEDRTIDPDSWTTHGPSWQIPFRMATQDLYYVWFYAPRIKRRPTAEVVETLACAGIFIGAIVWSIPGGWFWEFAVIYLIPQRIGLFVLAWWFDWLPHHGLDSTPQRDAYRTTRVRVGAEWLVTPVILYQNYHLVHHLHPSIPFYRYVEAWKRNELAYVGQNSPIVTAWGKELSPAEYRAWRKITDSYDEDGVGSGVDDSLIHQLTVADVTRLTEDSVAISFDVPENLRAEFRFSAGQHLTLHVPIGDDVLRRTYSICAAATSDLLRIGVRAIEGGYVSHHLNSEVKVGDKIGVQAPAGHFTVVPEPGVGKHYVGLAAGSGITPIISMLSTELLVEEGSRFTLFYANRTPDSTMFRDDLRMMERHFEGRLRLVEYFSDLSEDEAAALYPEPDGIAARLSASSAHSGLIDTGRILSQLESPEQVDGWFLCGPEGLVRDVRTGLIEDDVPADKVHLELFRVDTSTQQPQRETQPSTATATLRGQQTEFAVASGRSVLDAALDSGLDAPYACMGGACGTCRARLVGGEVEMTQNLVLNEQDLTDGYVLTCQSFPLTDRIEIDYDA